MGLGMGSRKRPLEPIEELEVECVPAPVDEDKPAPGLEHRMEICERFFGVLVEVKGAEAEDC